MSSQVSKVDLMDIFHSLTEISLASKDEREALDSITALARSALDSRFCTVIAIDQENNYLSQIACSGCDEEFKTHMAASKIRPGASHVDFDLIARADVVEKYNLCHDGQGVANPEVARKYGLNSALCYPLKQESRLIGYINHFSSSPEPFQTEEKQLLEIFARATEAAIRTFEILNSRRQLEKLNEYVQEMTEASETDRVLQLMLDKGLELVQGTRGWISRLDFDTGDLRIVCHRGDPPRLLPLRLGQGISGKALQDEHPLRVDNVNSERWCGIYEEFWEDTRSELAVPILISNAKVRVGRHIESGTKPIGVLNIESPIPGAFSKSDENIIWSLTRFGALMVERLSSDRKLADLTRIHLEMIGKQDWDDVIRTMMTAIKETLNYEYVNISLVKPEARRIKTEYITGITEPEAEAFKRLADHSLDSDDIQADVVRSRNIEVPGGDDSRFDPKIYTRFHLDRLVRVYIPMISLSNDRVIGTVDAGYRSDYRKYIYEQDVQILKGFIDYTVQAMERKQKGLIEKTSHELTAAAGSIRSNASFLQRRMMELEPDMIQRKLDDILLDSELIHFQIKELEYTLGRIPPSIKKERTLVFRRRHNQDCKSASAHDS